MRLCRIGATLVLAIVCLASPPSEADAGTYDVVACGGAAGAAQNAFAASADAGMSAYSLCPNTPSQPASGLVTRASATAGPGSVPYFAGGYQVFEAPPGASLVSVSFDLAAIRLANYWTVGVVAWDDDFNVGDLPYGCYAGIPGCGIGTPSFFGPVSVPLNGRTRMRFETRCVSLGRCDISASGFQPGMRALFSAANVTVRVQDFSPPAVVPFSGSLFANAWLRGSQAGYSLESDNVGVMINRTWVDGRIVHSEDFRDAGWPAWVACDFTRRRPCVDIPGAGSFVNTGGLPDGPHELRVEAIDAAGNAAAATRTIRVDNTPPARVDAVVDGGEGWRRSNRFVVRWRTPDRQAAPIAAAHYRLCDAEGRCTAGSGSSEALALGAPGTGDYTARIWLEDAAGNADAGGASHPVHLRFDDVPPIAAFELPDTADPRRVGVRVADDASGLSGGTVEIRRRGRRSWEELATDLSGNRLSAHLDDLSLPDGIYELRARVEDRAGNETIAYERSDGLRMELVLPLRGQSRISLTAGAHKRRCTRPRRRARRRCRASRRVPKVIRGSIEAGRTPLAGAELSVLERRSGATGFRRVRSVFADESGRFRYAVGLGPSRTLRFAYAGTALLKPGVADVAFKVPAATTIRTSRSRLRNGRTVRFSGRLRGGPFPAAGKLIDLQAHYRGRWRTFATPRTDAGGRWRYSYRFEATRGLVVYRFRARIRRESDYPYELGYSKVVAVTVRGP